ncbi:VTC domain-containing protein [Streptomyces sp. NPDC058297]|uniref:VTC domain-containing protein n=1 Tax=Streptomyces sp. NPDC058297 TaxID=3346433 RepID=UPI0036E48C68
MLNRTPVAVRALARATLAARPVGLDESEAAAPLLRHHGHSYLVPVEIFQDFAALLTDPRRPGGPHRALCVGGRRWFGYRSTHFDTPALRSFHDHAQERAPRFGVRERLYQDSGKRQLELKVRGADGRTVKHRTRLGEGDHALDDTRRHFVAGVLRGTYGIGAPQELAARVVTEYRRATFVADGQRFTCDAGLVVRDAQEGRAVRADGGCVLVETKACAAGKAGAAGRPTDADRLLARFGVAPVAFGKYCGGLAALRPELAAGPWREAVRTLFPGTVPPGEGDSVSR